MLISTVILNETKKIEGGKKGRKILIQTTYFCKQTRSSGHPIIVVRSIIIIFWHLLWFGNYALFFFTSIYVCVVSAYSIIHPLIHSFIVCLLGIWRFNSGKSSVSLIRPSDGRDSKLTSGRQRIWRNPWAH